MDTWQDIHCEDVYDERADTWFLQAELAAWEQHCMDQANFELQEIAAQENAQ